MRAMVQTEFGGYGGVPAGRPGTETQTERPRRRRVPWAEPPGPATGQGRGPDPGRCPAHVPGTAFGASEATTGAADGSVVQDPGARSLTARADRPHPPIGKGVINP